jgi:preprotein translocase subunit SecY
MLRGLVHHAGWTYRLITVLTLTCGTACMWLSHYITQRGIADVQEDLEHLCYNTAIAA